MKKIIVFLLICLLFIGTDLYAEGNLIVNGAIGVGTNTPTSYIDVETADGWQQAVKAKGNIRTEPVSGTAVGTAAIGFQTVSSVSTVSGGKGASGAYYVVNDMTDNDVDIKGGLFWMIMQGVDGASSTMTKTKDQYGQWNILETRSWNTGATGTYNYSGTVYGSKSDFWRGANNRNWNYSIVKGYDVNFNDSGEGPATVTYENFYGYYMNDFPDSAVYATTNLYGLYVEKLTGGANNYGIVLDGDGAGADIVFGDAGGACRPGIYSNAGYVKAINKDCVESPVSPHDPETGEWVFYSKNVKTGKMVKVNMEKLVKAVEKITGEKFMIETIEEMK